MSHQSDIREKMGLPFWSGDPFRGSPIMGQIFEQNAEALATDPDLAPFLQNMGRQLKQYPQLIQRMEEDMRRHPGKADRLSEIIASGSSAEQKLLYGYPLDGSLPKQQPVMQAAVVPPSVAEIQPAALPLPEPATLTPVSLKLTELVVEAPPPPPPPPPPEAPQASEEAMRIARFLADNPGAKVRINNPDGRKVQESEFFFQHQNDAEKLGSTLSVAKQIDEMMGDTVKEKGQLRVSTREGMTAFTSNGHDLNEIGKPAEPATAPAGPAQGVRTFTAGGIDHSAPSQPMGSQPTGIDLMALSLEALTPRAEPAAQATSISLTGLSFGDDSPASSGQGLQLNTHRPRTPGLGGI